MNLYELKYLLGETTAQLGTPCCSEPFGWLPTYAKQSRTFVTICGRAAFL
jgi:hypothetical protein